MLNKDSAGFFSFYLKSYPAQSAMMVALLVLSGLLETVGVAMLFPLMAVITQQSGAGAVSGFAARIIHALAFFGIAPTIGKLLLIYVACITLKSYVLMLAMRRVGFTVAQVGTDLRLELIRALLHARWGHFGSQPIGRFANAIGQEAMTSSSAYREACAILASAIEIVVYICISIAVSWKLTLMSLIVGGSLLYGLRYFIEKARSAGRNQTVFARTLAGRVVEALQGLKAIKAMGEEPQFLNIMEGEIEALNQSSKHRIMASEVLRLAQEPLVAIILGTGLYFMIAVRGMPFGVVAGMTYIFYRLIKEINNLQMRYQLLAAGESAFWSLREQIDAAHEQRELIGDVGVRPELAREIRLSNVNFSHGENRVLRDLSLTIPVGEFVTLVGHSGAGKTTIIDLIVGLYQPASGSITIDGVSLADVNMREWRNSIGYVPQEILLFNGSIMNNVTLGDASISRDRVEAAITHAGASQFVMDREGGLDSLIGNSGVMLSGGQRQRLAIARALVRDPKILILDEVTAALDPITEAAICETLAGLKGDVTIVAISHQAALRDAADVVYHLDGGQVRQREIVTS